MRARAARQPRENGRLPRRTGGEGAELLRAVHDGLYQKALANREARTWTARTFDELKALAAEKSGFFKTMWCGDEACELRVKEEAGLTSRCMPFEQERIGDVCPICGRPATTSIIWGRAY